MTEYLPLMTEYLPLMTEYLPLMTEHHLCLTELFQCMTEYLVCLTEPENLPKMSKIQIFYPKNLVLMAICHKQWQFAISS